jgi:amino acid adenylation domain-containing protein
VTVVELLARLRDLDVKVWEEGDRLRVSAPRGVMTPELREQLAASKGEVLALLRAESGPPGTAPLSSAQQRLWFLAQLQPGSAAYNMAGGVRLQGVLDVPALERAVDEIVRRHAALRTTFQDDGGQPVQVIHPATPLGLSWMDLTTLGESAREDRVRELAAEEAARPFDLARGPLLRVTLIRLGPEAHVLLATTHHIVSDAWSMGIFVRELTTLYGAFVAGQPSPLPALRWQYADYARWQRGPRQAEVLDGQLAYWTRTLGGELPVLDLPADRPRPAIRTFAGAIERFALPAPLTVAVHDLARREQATPFMVLLAAFTTLLHRYTGQTDVVVGTPIANRSRLETEGLIGFFANTLVLRTDLSGAPTFRELLGRVRTGALGAFAHQEMPFDKLVEVLQPARDMSRSPLFDVMFGLQNQPAESLTLPGLRLTPLGSHSGTAKVDLTVQMGERDGVLGAVIEFSTELFDATTIRRMWEHFATVLGSAIADPDARITTLPMLSTAERRCLLTEWQGPASALPAVRWPALFERQVARTPEALAAVCGGKPLTYAELDRRANRLARHLRGHGVGPGRLVAVALDRSLDMLVALLGVLKAGGAYVPLDPTYPPERLAFVLADAGVSLLVTHAQVALPPIAGSIPMVRLDADAASLVAELPEPPEPVGGADDPAYVIYTSGSTGTPKGVEVPHRALVNLLLAMEQAPGLTASDVLLAVTSLSFDIAALELFLPLTVGARVVIAAREDALDGRRLGQLLDESGATVVQATPSAWRLLLDAGWQAQPGLRALSGGEALSATLASRLLDAGVELWNLYGPTETTIWSTAHQVRAGEPVVPIGRPIANTRAYVLDAGRQPSPIGVPGELYLGGLGVARGYRGRAELTAERFVPDPFEPEGGGRLYRTGDLVRWRADGTLEFLGRLDHQVKVRGFRIELGEIEAVLTRHPSVRDAVVTAPEDRYGDRRLVAYVVEDAGHPVAVGELRRHLAQTLPDYMVPTGFVVLSALPLTPNGKVDRRALPEPYASPTPVASEPRTPVEEITADIWADVLGLPAVGVGDNFFELGGHSLLATRVVSRLRDVYDIELPVRSLFEAPTVAELARHIELAQRGHADRRSVPRIQPVPRTGSLPLSFSQQRLWFFEQLEPGRDVYSITSVLLLRGPLDVAALEHSVTTVVARHEALRTTFASRDGEPVQRIHPPPQAWTVPVVDLRGLPPGERAAAAARTVAEHRARPFDLAAGPLVRVQVARLDDERWVLMVAAHHIVVDGWAAELFVRELAAVYGARVTGQAAALPPLPIQYADFAVWQREWLTGEMLAGELEYWKRQLAGAPAALELPLDRPRPSIQTFTGAQVVRVIDDDVRAALRALSRREGATLFMTVLAAFKALLARHSGQDDVCVGVPVAGRPWAETEPLIGVFINTLVLRTRLEGCGSFRELLRRVRETALGAYAHAELPFEKLVEELQPRRDLSRTPLFQVLFNMLNFGSAKPVVFPGLEVELPAASPTGVGMPAKFDLTLYVRDAADGLRLTAVYNADLFTERRMGELIDQFVQLLGAIATDTDIDIARVSLVTAASGPRLPDPTVPLTATWTESVVARFRAHAAAAPHRPAVLMDGQAYSYGELEAQSNRLARFLIEHGVGREDRVAIFAGRHAGLAWALLGVLKAGAGFMCLDPVYPPARTVACLRVAPPRAWIDLGGSRALPAPIAEHLATLPGLVTTTWPAASTDAAWTSCSSEPVTPDIHPDDLAYVAFTSGSTGAPKAIAGTHRPLPHFFAWYAETFGIEGHDRFAALSGLAHDPLLRDVLGAFWVGAAVCLPDPARLGQPGYLAAWLAEQRVSVVHLTPATANVLMEAGLASRPLPALRRVFFGGDVLAADVVERLRALAPDASYVNFYGATETPQAIAWHPVPPAPNAAGSSPIPLGRGIADVQLLIVNASGARAGVGEIGEIHVRTPYLARGYVGDPGLTAERFVGNPFTGDAADRVYRTGDFGRYRPDGTVEFAGRRDGQVNLRGFRVEVGDVEAALRRHPGVAATVVTLRHDAVRGAELVAYVVTAGEALDSEALRRHLGHELPAYMVPSIFVALERLPLTPNGKIDVAALPSPVAAVVRERRPPRTPTEKALAEIWSDTLGLEDLGVEDDFFELGGHSLLAVRLFARIEKVLGVPLPLATLFQASTIERQAALIDRRELQAPWRALVPIQPAGTRTPLFAVPGLGGEVVVFNPLARLLGPDQPFYGLQPRGLDGKQPPFTRVEEMAEHYLAEVRAVQPRGPYFLMGVCMGGLVAFEIAQRLQTTGEQVAFLALLDVRPPRPPRRWVPASRQRYSTVVARLVAGRLAAYGSVLWQRPSRRQAREVVGRLRQVFAHVSTTDPLRGVRGELYGELVTRANAVAMRNYVPRPYGGSLVLVLAADRKYSRGTDRRLAWRDLASGGIDICVVPGADSGLTLVQPNVRILAEEFRVRLAMAREGVVSVER